MTEITEFKPSSDTPAFETTLLDVITFLQIRDIDYAILSKHSSTVLKKKIKNNLPCIEYVSFVSFYED